MLKLLYERTWIDFHFMRAREWDLILKYLNPKHGMKVLDVACGGGIFSYRVFKRGASVIGFDLNKGDLKRAEIYNKGPKYMYLNAEKLPFAKGSFDSVFSVSSFEHFDYPGKALKEINRVLKKGGIFAGSVDSFSYHRVTEAEKKNHSKNHHIVTFFTREMLEKEMKKAGLEVIEHKFILNSYLSHIIMKIWIKLNAPRILTYILSPILIVITALYDAVCGIENEGYVLVFKAKKIK